MNEIVYLGGRPVALGLGDGSVGDLLAYRRAWEPFIAGHLELWRHLNEILEQTQIARDICPAGIFDPSQIRGNRAEASLCADLLLTRIRTSPTSPEGILPQWNMWKDVSDTDMVAGAKLMLEWHQNVVMKVGGLMKDDLTRIAALWQIPIRLPDLPPFSLQQEIIARIEGAFLATKGTLKLIGYAAGETLKLAGNTGEAVAEGLSDTAKALPKTVTNPLVWFGVAIAVALVGGALIVYYVPRRSQAAPAALPTAT